MSKSTATNVRAAPPSFLQNGIGRFAAKPPRSVLVVVTRRIGDVLLATPLIRSLKAAWPSATVDVLVFRGTEGVLAANSDVRCVFSIEERPSSRTQLALLASVLRRYDLALSVVPSDRSTLYAWLAGKWRAGLVPNGAKHGWKRWLLNCAVPFDDLDTHTVPMHLSLANAVGIPPLQQVVAEWRDDDRAALERIVAFAITRHR